MPSTCVARHTHRCVSDVTVTGPFAWAGHAFAAQVHCMQLRRRAASIRCTAVSTRSECRCIADGKQTRRESARDVALQACSGRRRRRQVVVAGLRFCLLLFPLFVLFFVLRHPNSSELLAFLRWRAQRSAPDGGNACASLKTARPGESFTVAAAGHSGRAVRGGAAPARRPPPGRRSKRRLAGVQFFERWTGAGAFRGAPS